MQENSPTSEIKTDLEATTTGFEGLLAEIEPWQKLLSYAQENPIFQNLIEQLRADVNEIFVPAIVMETLRAEMNEPEYLQLFTAFKESQSAEELAERLNGYSSELMEKIKSNLTAEIEQVLQKLEPNIQSIITDSEDLTTEEAKG